MLLALLACPTGVLAKDVAPAAKRQLGRCVEGSPDPAPAPLRPTQTARCPYDVHEVYRRLLRLTASKEGRVDIGYAERLFGLPSLYTAYDDPRSARFSVILAGGEGDAQWRGMVVFDESFGPDVETRPLRFRGSKRPVRIRPGERGYVGLSINLFPLQPAQAWPGCLTLDRFIERAEAAGWARAIPVFATDGGPASLGLDRGGLSLFPGSGYAGDCLTEVTLYQVAKPAIPPIMGEEETLIRRHSADAIAAETEAKWLALPADDQDDRDARNARAKFMRDWVAQIYLETPRNAGDDAIATMTPERLRAFARDAMHGTGWWGTAHEICDLAVKETDPPAALARLAAERRLDAAAAELVRTYCSIYVEGRRFKHPSLPIP
jgi:hypothetical protein